MSEEEKEERAPLGTRERLAQLGAMIKELQDECISLMESAITTAKERKEGLETKRSTIDHSARALAAFRDAWSALGKAHEGTR